MDNTIKNEEDIEMALLDSMSRDLGKAIRVSIDKIRINRLNEVLYDDVEDDMLNGLMDSIKEHGQMENAIAYKDNYDYSGDVDGKEYTLIGGNTRYMAIKKLYENGEGDGYINITIIDKPENHNKELEIMISNNIQRRKSSEERYHEIQIFEAAYRHLPEKPNGTKRDWIGEKLGISGRYVDKLINKFNPRQDEPVNNEEEQVPSINNNDVVEGQTNIYEYINDDHENEMESSHEMSFNCNNMQDVTDLVKSLKGNIKSLNKSIDIANIIGYQDDIAVELNDLKDNLNEILLSLNNHH